VRRTLVETQSRQWYIFGTWRREEGASDESETPSELVLLWWRGQDLNLRPSGYEPDELPSCSTPRRSRGCTVANSHFDHNPPEVRAINGSVQQEAEVDHRPATKR
jgi:hypothetical protein